MKKIFFALIFSFIFSGLALASDNTNIEVWQDPAFNFSELKKVFVMPVKLELKAGNNLIPEKKLNENIISWMADGIGASMGGKGKVIVKPYDALVKDMEFIYGDKIPEDKEFYKAASEMGYGAFIVIELYQEFVSEHVPEQIRTYTEYKEIERRDSKGRLIETLKIPEEKTEVIPAHDVTYLSTRSNPALYDINDIEGDYVAVVQSSIRREYMGGPVLKVVENLVKSSMKSLFAHENKNSKSKSKRRK